MTTQFANLFKHFFDSEKVAGLLLVCCALISLLKANSSIGAGYINFMHAKADLSFAAIGLTIFITNPVFVNKELG